MQIGELFQNISSEIQVTDEEISNAIDKHSEVRKEISSNMNNKIFLSGSYKKNTGVKPLNDVDIFVWLDKEEWGYETLTEISDQDPEKFLEKLKRKFKKLEIEHQSINIQNHSLGIRYENEDNFTVDIIPGFAAIEPSSNDNFDRRFLIPEKDSSEWINTNPEKSRAALSSANDIANKKIVPILKLIKRKKNCLGTTPHKFLKSFHIEALLMYIASTKSDIYTERGNLYDVLLRCLEEMLEFLDKSVGIKTKLGLDNDPALYLIDDPKRRKYIIRKLGNMISVLEAFETISDEDELEMKVRDFFCLDEEDNKAYTGVSRNVKPEKFG